MGAIFHRALHYFGTCIKDIVKSWEPRALLYTLAHWAKCIAKKVQISKLFSHFSNLAKNQWKWFCHSKVSGTVFEAIFLYIFGLMCTYKAGSRVCFFARIANSKVKRQRGNTTKKKRRKGLKNANFFSRQTTCTRTCAPQGTVEYCKLTHNYE